jgi:hypothetical protein
MKYHIQGVHKEVFREACDICGKYVSQRDMQRHFDNVHGKLEVATW